MISPRIHATLDGNEKGGLKDTPKPPSGGRRQSTTSYRFIRESAFRSVTRSGN
jgi:hypothetical protein